MRTVTLPGGEIVPAFGLGTWRMGEHAGERRNEIAALRRGLDLGVRLIDTAEMYGDGGAEEVVREALAGCRDDVFIVSKVLPRNATRKGTVAACERSLGRLGTDRIDLYLLHWRETIPLAETLASLTDLQAAGKIRHWGVSNFDVADMADLAAHPQGRRCATNQVLYHLGERGIEWQLLPDSIAARMPVMAYSPLGQGSILAHPGITSVARRHGVSPATVAVAWTLHRPGVISIPKTSRTERVADLVASIDLVLDPADLTALDRAFPPPTRAMPLAML